MVTTTDSALLRLLQLGSVNLPVGGFAFSQGMEYANDAGWLKTPESVREWLSLQLHQSLARLDLALVFRLHKALQHQDKDQLCEWNRFLLASRETHELRLTDSAMGAALLKLLSQLEVPVLLPQQEQPSFVTLFVCAGHHWGLNARTCALGIAWCWLENQVCAATKLVPLGQTRAQQLLSELQQDIPAAINLASVLTDDELGGSLTGLAIASCLHETQYSRLFRS